MSYPSDRLNIAYTMQNIGVDIDQDVGAPILVKYTLRGLKQAGHRVSLLALKGRSVIVVKDASKLNCASQAALGLTATRPFLLFESGVRRLQRELGLSYYAFFDTYRFYEACCRYLANYTLCHEYGGLFSLGAALACLKLGIPYILTSDADLLLERAVIDKPLRGLHARVAAWEARMSYGLARKIICVSEPAKQHLIQTWDVDPEKIVVVPNGVDIELFTATFSNSQAVRAQLGLSNQPVVMFVGGFQPWHGLENLVESFAQVVRLVPEAILLLVGDGPIRSAIEQKSAELGLADRVIITGFVPHDRIPEMLAIADVVTAPYPRLPEEMWFSPLKLYEYMAAGKAIVASKEGQISDVIQDGCTGLLVEAGDVEGLAQALIKLLEAPAERERLGQNARRQAVKQHSWEQYIRRLEEIYMSVL